MEQIQTCGYCKIEGYPLGIHGEKKNTASRKNTDQAGLNLIQLTVVQERVWVLYIFHCSRIAI
jgi:hypothetical protein